MSSITDSDLCGAFDSSTWEKHLGNKIISTTICTVFESVCIFLSLSSLQGISLKIFTYCELFYIVAANWKGEGGRLGEAIS